MKYPVVYVQWRDATSFDAWQSIKDAKTDDAHLIHSVGWLIKSDNEQFTLALNMDVKEKAVSQTLIIPRAWCEVIKTLRSPA